LQFSPDSRKIGQYKWFQVFAAHRSRSFGIAITRKDIVVKVSMMPLGGHL
jgi:hypothetical protein